MNEPLLMLEDELHSASERRFHALGQSDAGRRLHVRFRLRRDETLIRVKERMFYEQEV